MIDRELTIAVRELIREQLTQMKIEERDNQRREEVLNGKIEEKPLTANEIQEIRNIIREKRNEKYMTGLPRVVSKEEWKY